MSNTNRSGATLGCIENFQIVDFKAKLKFEPLVHPQIEVAKRGVLK